MGRRPARRLLRFRSVCENYERSIPAGEHVGDLVLRGILYRQEHTAKAILRELDPILADFDARRIGGVQDAVASANRGLGVLADMEHRPRLRLPGDRSSLTWKSRQRGARALAQGCYAGLRNVVAHDDPDWSEQEALEALACLSVLARWIDEAEVETG